MNSAIRASRLSALDRFDQLASEPRFAGWPLVGEPQLGPEIPYFGRTLNYQLQTGNGIEDYTSILRSFGWAVVFGLTQASEVITLVQWKPGVNCASWELPPGGIGKIPPGTSPEEVLIKTRATYLKETGYGGGTWEHLASPFVETGKYRGPGPNDHGLPVHLYLATGLEQMANARVPNPNEIIETLMVPS